MKIWNNKIIKNKIKRRIRGERVERGGWQLKAPQSLFFSLSFFLILLFTSSLICGLIRNVDGAAYEPAEKVPLWKELWEGVFDPVVYFLGTFIQRVLLIYNSVSRDIHGIINITYGNLERFLLLNPNLDNISYLTKYFISILEPLYVTAIIFLGIYIIFLSGSPLGRAKAKASLIKLFFSMIIITISPLILKVLFSISHGLTQNILSLGPMTFIELHKNSVLYSLDMVQKVGIANIPVAIPFIFFSFLLVLGFFLIVIARYFLVLLLSVLFPLAIFSYSFSLTRNTGKILIMQLFFWTFLPLSFAIALVAIAFGENIFHSLIYELWSFDLAGTIALILSPIGMFYATKWLGKVAVKISENFSSSIEERMIPELRELEEHEPLSEGEIEATLKELSNERGEISLEDIKKNEILYQQLKKESGKEEITLEEYLREKYRFKLLRRKRRRERRGEMGEGELLRRRIIGVGVVGGEYPPLEEGEKYEEGVIITPQRERIIIPHPRRKKIVTKGKIKELTIELKPSAKPLEVEFKIQRGGKKPVVFNVVNLTNIVLHNINLFDQGLVEDNIFIDYSEKKFNLRPGETKIINVTITVLEIVKPRIYRGQIIVTCMEGMRNFVDVKVVITPQEERIPLSQREVEESLKKLVSTKHELYLKDIEENEELFEQLKDEAKNQGKTVEEYLREQYKIKLVEGGAERGKIRRKERIGEEERLVRAITERRMPEEEVSPRAPPKVPEKEVKEKKEVKIKLAPPAPEAPPKITRSPSFH
jgi:hypothetical protein